jgi:DNA-binding transcriptional ArsR family regulator
MSGKTLSRHMKDLEEKGLLAEREMEISDGKSEMVYYFPTGDIYKIINKEMLYYLISTRNKCAVKVYLFLLNWY